MINWNFTLPSYVFMFFAFFAFVGGLNSLMKNKDLREKTKTICPLDKMLFLSLILTLTIISIFFTEKIVEKKNLGKAIGEKRLVLETIYTVDHKFYFVKEDGVRVTKLYEISKEDKEGRRGSCLVLLSREFEEGDRFSIRLEKTKRKIEKINSI